MDRGRKLTPMPVKTVLSSRVPIKVWTDDVEDSARRQLINTGALPFVFRHVAAMNAHVLQARQQHDRPDEVGQHRRAHQDPEIRPRRGFLCGEGDGVVTDEHRCW